MSQQWILRVASKEYGPAGLETLLEWKEDGRVLPENEVRRSDANVWMKAADISGLFESTAVAIPPRQIAGPAVAARSLRQICVETIRIFGKGFFQFLGLTLLVAVPSICWQLTGAFLEASPNLDVDLRTLLTGTFGLCMLFLTLTAWPIYVAGIQILTAELAAGRRLGFFALLNEAVKFWPRVAFLSVFVFVAFVFWGALPLAIIYGIALGGPSVVSFFFALSLAVFQIWIVGRLFINFMFWQQAAVLENCAVAEALRVSKKLARSGRELAWYQRPLWRGALIFSLWTAFVIAINLPMIWPQFREYWHQVTTSQDPQALLRAMSAAPKPSGFDPVGLGFYLLQKFLRPLLGIAFVLIYFDARERDEDKGEQGQSLDL
jgi:hypothetical protein